MADDIEKAQIGTGRKDNLKVISFDDELEKLYMEPTKDALVKNFHLRAVYSPDELLKIIEDPSVEIDQLIFDIIVEIPPQDERLKDKELHNLGLEILALLRSGALGDKRKKLPVILLTGTTYRDTIDKLNKILQTDSYTLLLQKPTAPSKLIESIKEMHKI